MNFPNRIAGHVLSVVALIFGGAGGIPKRFPDNGDDRGISDFQPFS
jgi:hypothetical protein